MKMNFPAAGYGFAADFCSPQDLVETRGPFEILHMCLADLIGFGRSHRVQTSLHILTLVENIRNFISVTDI